MNALLSEGLAQILPVTTLLASLLGLLLLRLSLRVIALRRENKVPLGDGGNEALQRAIRGQANCAEYVPIGVLLMLIAELQGANTWLLAALAVMFLGGRLAHGYAFAFTSGSPKLRVGGMQLTLGAIGLLSILNLVMVAIGLLAPGNG